MYEHVFVAGTFDRFHKGHISLLRSAFGMGQTVTVGITSDDFIKKFKNTPHRNYSDRRKTVANWLVENGFMARSKLIGIDNPYEPAVSGQFSAIVVTSENKHRGEEINALREQKKLVPLAIIEVPIVSAEDGLPISSTRVREGRIDESGHLVMPDMLRKTLAIPMGIVLEPDQIVGEINTMTNKITISVGDITTTKIMKLGLVPTLAIIDLKVHRKPFQTLAEYRFPESTMVVHASSGPGYISSQAVSAVKMWSKHPKSTVLVIDGEEDLMTLPAIVYAPIGSVLFYGQPNLPFFITTKGGTVPVREGMVKVIVDQKSKEHAMELMGKFEQNNT